MPEDIIFYTYLWLREDGTPYYAGKGVLSRVYGSHKRIGKCPPKDRVIIQEWENEQEALEAERLLIAIYGRQCNKEGVLLNISSGGQHGGTGAIRTEETRKKISAVQLGKKRSEEHRRNIGLGHLGKKKGPHSSATKKQISEKLKGRKIPIEVVLKREQTVAATKASPEYREKMRAAANKRWQKVAV